MRKLTLPHMIIILVLTCVLRSEVAFGSNPLVGTYWVEENGKFYKFIAVRKIGTQYSLAEISETTGEPDEDWIPLTRIGPETKKPWMILAGLGVEIPSFTGVEWRESASDDQGFRPPDFYIIKAPKKSVFRGAKGTRH